MWLQAVARNGVAAFAVVKQAALGAVVLGLACANEFNQALVLLKACTGLLG